LKAAAFWRAPIALRHPRATRSPPGSQDDCQRIYPLRRRPVPQRFSLLEIARHR
jgi:hypothetical protein